MRGAILRRVKRALLAADPGLMHAEQALETLAAVLIAAVALRPFGQPASLFGVLAAGFVLQCVAGRTRRAQLAGMAAVGLALVVVAALGALLGHVPVVGTALLIAGAFVALRARSAVPSPTFTLFPFVFLALSAALARSAARVPAEALAIAAGVACALVVHAIAPRPSAARAYDHVLSAFCAESASLLRLLAAVACGADPDRLGRRIDRGLRALERGADLGGTIADTLGDGEPPLDALVRDQHEAVHAVVALRRSVESDSLCDDARRALAALLARLADAMRALADQTRRDLTGGVRDAIRDVEATAIAAPCRPATELGALAVAAAVAGRLDAVCAHFAEAR